MITPRAPKDCTILVVDDEELLREAVVFDFKRKGYKVLSASCGNEAIEVLEKNPVDVVVSDVRMPNGSGIDLLGHIKQKNVFLPVVMFVTGFADISLEEAYALGADAVFPKPFDRKALHEAVERAMQPAETRFNRRDIRIEVAMGALLKIISTGKEVPIKVINVGRGGFFAEMERPAAMGETVEFALHLSVPSEMDVSGKAIVRWSRGSAEGPGKPAGCGLEFLEFDDKCRKQFIESINLLKTRAYIPR